MKKHRHKCGYRTDESTRIGGPTDNVMGCGFIWEHPRENEHDKRAYLEAHICPNCGIGPWFAVVTNPADVLAHLTPMPPTIGMGRVLRPAEDNLAYVAREDLDDFAEHAIRMQLRDWGVEESVDELISFLIGEGIIPKDGSTEIVIIDEDNNTISGFAVDTEEVRMSRRRLS